MKEMIKRIVLKIKKSMAFILKPLYYKFNSIKSAYYLNRISHKKTNNDSIKVGFIVQMPEVWDKQSPIFEAMTADTRFDPYLIVVPSYDIVNSKISKYASELKYFLDKYDKKYIIRAYKNKWYDLRSGNFDYIFFQRCWEIYLPKQYHTNSVIKYAKTCYLPYAYGGLYDGKYYYKSKFYKNLYLTFCATDDQVKFHEKSKYKKIINLGSPVLENIYLNISEHHKCDTEYKTILWTPRWTDDKYYGGSTFLSNMYNIINLQKEISEYRVICPSSSSDFPKCN